jgi:hypothetical protein
MRETTYFQLATGLPLAFPVLVVPVLLPTEEA